VLPDKHRLTWDTPSLYWDRRDLVEEMVSGALWDSGRARWWWGQGCQKESEHVGETEARAGLLGCRCVCGIYRMRVLRRGPWTPIGQGHRKDRSPTGGALGLGEIRRYKIGQKTAVLPRERAMNLC
jgi:hypothetical protein